MEWSRSHKWIVASSFVLLAIAFALSRTELQQRTSMAVGLAEILFAGVIGILLGISAAKKN